MIFDGVDTDIFQGYLDHLAEAIPPDPGPAPHPHPGQRFLAQSRAAVLAPL